MADLAITAALVVPDDGYSYLDGIAGEAVTRGMALYLKASDSRYWKAHCETSLATALVGGLALQDVAAGQPVRVMTGGTITIGATVGIGTLYILSAAGLLCPVTDLATADWLTYIGGGKTAAKIELRIHALGVQKAA